MKQHLTIQRTAHYYLQKPSDPIQSIIVVLHGYAQLASTFISTFSPLRESNSLVVAPEAISKFYNSEKKVVASWMTSEHREDEMKDYILFLNTLIHEIINKYGNLPIAVLGFSQGVSTVMRWVANCDVKINEVHLCSGTIPPELDSTKLVFNKDSVYHYYYGSEDRLLKVEKAKEQISFLETLVSSTKIVEFNGRHEVSDETIQNLMRFSETSKK